MIKQGVFDTWHVMIKHNIDDFHKVREMKNWCILNVELNDPEESHHCRKYAFTYERFPRKTNFVFDREKDAVLFALRWT